MSKRTTASAVNGSKEVSAGEPALDKQKKLLSEDNSHFTMIKMLHLADLITELNGMASCSSTLL